MLLWVFSIHKGSHSFLFFIYRIVVEVIGTVDNNCSITIRLVTPFDVPSYSMFFLLFLYLDTNGYNKLVEYMNGKFKQVFC